MERRQDVAVGLVHPHPSIPKVRHVYVPLAVHRYVRRTLELAAILLAEAHQVPAIRCELLHPVVSPVGDVDVPVPVDGNPPGPVELSVSGARSAECQQKLPVLRELLDPVVPALHHPEIVVRIELDTRRSVQLSRPNAMRPKGGNSLAVRIERGKRLCGLGIELLDDVLVLVGNVDPPLRVHRYPHWPCELPSGEVPKMVLVQRRLADAAIVTVSDLPLAELVAATQHEDVAVRRDGQIDRIPVAADLPVMLIRRPTQRPVEVPRPPRSGCRNHGRLLNPLAI